MDGVKFRYCEKATKNNLSRAKKSSINTTCTYQNRHKVCNVQILRPENLKQSSTCFCNVKKQAVDCFIILVAFSQYLNFTCLMPIMICAGRDRRGLFSPS